MKNLININLCNIGILENILKLMLTDVIIVITVEEDGSGLYFTNNWFNFIELWAMQFRVNLFGMGNNTTNRLER